MAIPLVYNIRSVRERWASSLVAVLGIAGVVAVFVATLALAKGFRSAMVESGSPDTVLIRRAGSNSEMESGVDLDQVKIIADAPEIVRDSGGVPYSSAEVVVIAAFRHRKSDADALAQVRGVTERALETRSAVTVAEGRFFRPGLPELVVGRNAEEMYVGLELGSRVKFGGQDWEVVGVLDAGGSALDSEIWCDASILQQTYDRPQNIFSSVTARLNNMGDLEAFKDRLTSDPRLTVQVESERDYYRKQSRLLLSLITFLGGLVSLIMALGAVFGALNVLLASVVSRLRELATMRALGFSPAALVLSMIFESLFVSFIGGLLGCIAIYPLNGLTTSTLNFQTFSQVAFDFMVTPTLMAVGLVFALGMGFVGGLLPSIRAARVPVASALREL